LRDEQVKVGGTASTVMSHNNTNIIFISPIGSGLNTEVTIAFSSSPIFDTYKPKFSYNPPTITSISPTNGATRGEYELTITGTNFGPDNRVKVVFKSNPGTTISVAAKSDLTHVYISLMPAHIPGDDEFYVIVYGPSLTLDQSQRTSDTIFTYDQPRIMSIQPTMLASYALSRDVTIKGSSFWPDPLLVTIQINSTLWGIYTCTLKDVPTYETITCTLPQGEGTNFIVQVGIKPTIIASNTSVIFNFAAPAITSFEPTTGSMTGDTVIIVHGDNFGMSLFCL
jgi:hypothetical protein